MSTEWQLTNSRTMQYMHELKGKGTKPTLDWHWWNAIDVIFRVRCSFIELFFGQGCAISSRNLHRNWRFQQLQFHFDVTTWYRRCNHRFIWRSFVVSTCQTAAEFWLLVDIYDFLQLLVRFLPKSGINMSRFMKSNCASSAPMLYYNL